MLEVSCGCRHSQVECRVLLIGIDADVADSDRASQGRGSRCDSDMRLLELSWASTWSGGTSTYHMHPTKVIGRKRTVNNHGKESWWTFSLLFLIHLCSRVWLQWKARLGQIHKGNLSTGALRLPQYRLFHQSWVGLRVCFPSDLNNWEKPCNVERNILPWIVLYVGCSSLTEIDKLVLVSPLGCRGFPFWLRDVPGIIFRTDNEPFKVLQSSHVGPGQVNLIKWFPSHDFFFGSFTSKPLLWR